MPMPWELTLLLILDPHMWPLLLLWAILGASVVAAILVVLSALVESVVGLLRKALRR